MKGVYDWFIGFCDEKSPSYGLKQAQEALSAMVRGEQILQTLAEAGLTEESVLEVMRALGVITKYNQENKDPKERVAGSVFNTCEKVLWAKCSGRGIQCGKFAFPVNTTV